ncbi:hypothetical protein BDR03DRAFT_1013112 [Suillus americanus]|nr:hypothetical protein BDR03DRAFT_1013112 [Suillus americanus]
MFPQPVLRLRTKFHDICYEIRAACPFLLTPFKSNAGQGTDTPEEGLKAGALYPKCDIVNPRISSATMTDAADAQAYIRETHPPTCLHHSCNEQIIAPQPNLHAHQKLHEQQELEAALADVEPSEATDLPHRHRRSGEVGRDWKCGKEFKSMKALTTHNDVIHLGYRNHVCPYQHCFSAFGYTKLPKGIWPVQGAINLTLVHPTHLSIDRIIVEPRLFRTHKNDLQALHFRMMPVSMNQSQMQRLYASRTRPDEFDDVCLALTADGRILMSEAAGG